jgi:hypothetical protein
MAPLLSISLHTRDSKGGFTDPSLISAIVLVSLIGVALSASLTILLAKYIRRRREGTAQANDQPPLLSTVSSNSSKNSSSSFITEYELPELQPQRQAVTRDSVLSDHGDVMNDWKEFEADIRTHPSRSLKNHPGLRSQPVPPVPTLPYSAFTARGLEGATSNAPERK